MFAQAHAIFIPYLISDHCPTMLNLPNAICVKKKAFKFANFVAEKKEFLPLVKQYWEEEFVGCEMFKTVKRLKNLKKHLKRLAWEKGNVFENVINIRDKLKKVQTEIDRDPDDKKLREEESVILVEYMEALKIEEKLLFQKAKIKWLSLGDRNNAFFHRTLKSRYHKNRISAIEDCMGNRVEGENVADLFVQHFQKFLGESVPVEEVDLNTTIKKKLTDEEANIMIRDVSDEEIKNAMFQINDNKAPGPDGYSSSFYKKAWGVIGADVCKAVKEFFVNGKMLSELNSTLITLVPKIPIPRPIACCNVLYKCINKIITERMKGCLGKLVSQN